MPAEKSLTIGKLAAATGVSVDAIRYYEREKLLPVPARTASGYRLYEPSSAERIDFIRRAQALGFSLAEIRTLLGLQDGGGSSASVKAIAEEKIAEMSSRIDDLSRMREVLQELAGRCSGRGSVSGCPIIEALASDSGEPGS